MEDNSSSKAFDQDVKIPAETAEKGGQKISEEDKEESPDDSEKGQTVIEKDAPPQEVVDLSMEGGITKLVSSKDLLDAAVDKMEEEESSVDDPTDVDARSIKEEETNKMVSATNNLELEQIWEQQHDEKGDQESSKDQPENVEKQINFLINSYLHHNKIVKLTKKPIGVVKVASS